MFRFSIRDVLWLMTVVALAVSTIIQWRELEELRYERKVSLGVLRILGDTVRRMQAETSVPLNRP
jgi:hypothetical protein